MNVKCPCCDQKFPVTEDDILLDYDADYNNSETYVWENIPLLKLKFQIVPEDLKKN